MRDDATLRPSTGRLFFGLVVMALGVLLTLDNLRIIEARDVLRFWPVVLVVVGVSRIVQNLAHWRGEGLLWIAIGAWLLAARLGYRIRIDLWPVALILLGAVIAWRGFHPGRKRLATESDEALNAFALMAGVKQANNSPAFRRGDCFAMMGGCEIDLREAKIAPGEEAVIDTFAFMGGIEIRVPPEWSVTSRILPIMGGFENNTTPPKDGGGPRLVMTGFAMMGGVEVKN